MLGLVHPACARASWPEPLSNDFAPGCWPGSTESPIAPSGCAGRAEERKCCAVTRGLLPEEDPFWHDQGCIGSGENLRHDLLPTIRTRQRALTRAMGCAGEIISTARPWRYPGGRALPRHGKAPEHEYPARSPQPKCTAAQNCTSERSKCQTRMGGRMAPFIANAQIIRPNSSLGSRLCRVLAGLMWHSPGRHPFPAAPASTARGKKRGNPLRRNLDPVKECRPLSLRIGHLDSVRIGQLADATARRLWYTGGGRSLR